MAVKDQKIAQFALIKQFLEQQIKSQQWAPGRRIPTEQSLADTFSVSRMTARRAVQELADAGLLSRTQGSGTFVAEPIKRPATLEIYNIVDSAKAKNTHSHRMLSVDAVQATSKIAHLMELETDTLVFQLKIIHFDNDQPIQWQQLWVNRKFVPALLKQKLDKIDPNDYLQWACPPNRTDYQVTAVMPSASQRLDLNLANQDTAVCLQVSRRDWVADAVTSYCQMLHPADSYFLGKRIEVDQ